MENFLVSHFSSKTNNKLINGILYQLNNLDEVENNIIKIVKNLEQEMNRKLNITIDATFIIKVLIYIYNSYIIVLDFPHMLDKVNRKKRPCLHIVIGETISQLVSIALLSESINFINNNTLISNNIKVKLFKEVYNHGMNFSSEIYLLESKSLKMNNCL